jgi:hypothetical protein
LRISDLLNRKNEFNKNPKLKINQEMRNDIKVKWNIIRTKVFICIQFVVANRRKKHDNYRALERIFSYQSVDLFWQHQHHIQMQGSKHLHA